MSTLETVLLMILVIDAIALIALILIQQGKGADVGAAFGSGGANTVFGSAGSASFLTKMTAWLSIGLFVISFALAYTAKERAAGMGDEGIPQTPIEETVPAGSPSKGMDSTPEPTGVPAQQDTGGDIPEL